MAGPTGALKTGDSAVAAFHAAVHDAQGDPSAVADLAAEHGGAVAMLAEDLRQRIDDALDALKWLGAAPVLGEEGTTLLDLVAEVLPRDVRGASEPHRASIQERNGWAL